MPSTSEITWLPVKGFENLYHVSSTGMVKSLRRNIIMKVRIDQGYRRVRLSAKGKSSAFKVARLVAAAFVPNPQKKPAVNHINGHKTDDAATNLEWCTTSENCLHAVRMGLSKCKRTTWGSKHPHAIFTEETIIAIRRRKLAGGTTRSLAKEFHTSGHTISSICRGRTWKHVPEFLPSRLLS